jgi:hypothetical protein
MFDSIKDEAFHKFEGDTQETNWAIALRVGCRLVGLENTDDCCSSPGFWDRL